MAIALASGSERPPYDDDLFVAIADAIEAQGYVVLPAALPEAVASGLLDYMAELNEADFHEAAVGRGTDQAQNRFVRRDRIRWLPERLAAVQPWQQWTAGLQTTLNRRLFLGLFSFESQLAHYAPGDFYRKHRDAFRGESNRVLSVVTYLNRGWEPGQGGELVLYDPQDDTRELLRVQPAYGTVVVFLSEEFAHEVLPAARDRYSVAGWFRVNASMGQQIDPPR